MSFISKTILGSPFSSLEQLDSEITEILTKPRHAEADKELFSRFANILKSEHSELVEQLALNPSRCKLIRHIGINLRKLDDIFFKETIQKPLGAIQHKARIRRSFSSDSKENKEVKQGTRNKKSKKRKILKPPASFIDIDYVSKMIRKQPRWGMYGEVYLKRNGEALGQAYRLTNALNIKGKPVLYTAQRTDAVFFQVVMKKIHESLYGDLGKNRKILRTDYTATLSSIQEAGFKDIGDKYKSLICASINIFHCQYGESVNFFLNDGQSHASLFNLGKAIRQELIYYQSEGHVEINGNISDFVSKITRIYDDYKKKLPNHLLEVIIPDVKDLSTYVRLCTDEGEAFTIPFSHTDSAALRDYLLKANKSTKELDDVQARVLAPRPNLKRLKVVRCIGKKDKKIFDQAKKELAAAVEELLRPSKI